MQKPIKRVWVPPQPALAPVPAATAPSAGMAAPAAAIPAVRKQVFSELPETEVEERNSDSIWAEFDSVYASTKAGKASSA